MDEFIKEDKCLDTEELRLYLQNKLDAQQRQILENHLLDCDLCNDAVEGYIEFPEEVDAGAMNINSNKRSVKWFSYAATICFFITAAIAVTLYSKANKAILYIVTFTLSLI